MDDIHDDENDLIAGPPAETPAEPPVTDLETPSSDYATMANLEELIRMSIAKIERLRVEYKKQNEMLESVLAGDPTYRDHSEKAKEANKVKLTTKSEIMKRPDVKPVAEKVRELKAEIRDAQDSLSNYLPEYNRVSGQNQIEDADGQIREILYVAKLVKRSTSKK